MTEGSEEKTMMFDSVNFSAKIPLKICSILNPVIPDYTKGIPWWVMIYHDNPKDIGDTTIETHGNTRKGLDMLYMFLHFPLITGNLTILTVRLLHSHN